MEEMTQQPSIDEGMRRALLAERSTVCSAAAIGMREVVRAAVADALALGGLAPKAVSEVAHPGNAETDPLLAVVQLAIEGLTEVRADLAEFLADSEAARAAAATAAN